MNTQCEVPVNFKVFQNTDSVFGVFLLKNNEAIQDLSFIQKVVLANADETIDSSLSSPGTITWTEQGEYFGTTANFLNFKLGNLGLVDGVKTGYRITVYDAVNVNGIPYVDGLTIEFVSSES